MDLPSEEAPAQVAHVHNKQQLQEDDPLEEFNDEEEVGMEAAPQIPQIQESEKLDVLPKDSQELLDDVNRDIP